MALIYPLAASAAMLALPENLKYDPSSGGFNLTAGDPSSEGGFGIPRFGGLQGLPFEPEPISTEKARWRKQR